VILGEIWRATTDREKRLLAVAFGLRRSKAPETFWYAKDGEDYFRGTDPLDPRLLSSTFLWDQGWYKRVSSKAVARSEGLFLEGLRRADPSFDTKLEGCAAFVVADTSITSFQRVDIVLVGNAGLFWYEMPLGAGSFKAPQYLPFALADDPRLGFNQRQPALKALLSALREAALRKDDSRARALAWAEGLLKEEYLGEFGLPRL